MSRRVTGNRSEQQCNYCRMNTANGAHKSADECITALGHIVEDLDIRLRRIEDRREHHKWENNDKCIALEAGLADLKRQHDLLNQYVHQNMVKTIGNPTATARVSSNNILLDGLGLKPAQDPIGTRPGSSSSNQQQQASATLTGHREIAPRSGLFVADRAGTSSQQQQEASSSSWRAHKAFNGNNKKPDVPPKPRLESQNSNSDTNHNNISNSSNSLRRAMSPQPYRSYKPYRNRWFNHQRQQQQQQTHAKAIADRDPTENAIVQFLSKHHRPTFFSNNVNCSGQNRNDGQLELIIEGGWQEESLGLGPTSYKPMEPRRLTLPKNTTCKQLHDLLRPNNERAVDEGELNLLFVQHRIVPECEKTLWSLGMRNVSHVLIVPDRIDFGDQIRLAYLRKGPNVSGNQMRRAVSEF